MNWNISFASYHIRPRVCARIFSDNHHLLMDSIPQELIDEIIENVPKSSLLSCSLVAKRWQRESQRRAFDSISFLSEDDVNQWCTDISQDLDGISSYVRHAHFKWIYSWNEPALFSRILGNLSSLTALSVYRTEIPDEFPDHISRGEFGKGITALYLHSPHCTLATMTSMILSLPDLKELSVKVYWVELEEPLPTHSITPRRGPLDSLELSGDADGIGENLAKSRFISSRLFLEVHIPDAVQLLTLSSETVVELKLRGVWFLQILRPSRDDSDQSSRYFNQGDPPSHPPTVISCPYHSGCLPS